jgi:ectoine hydroxylase-related dioxygenase (phytanoyl-CoA dioxygenase family)
MTVPRKEEAISMSYRAPAFADALPELAAPGCTPERLAYLEEHGFVIITDFVDNPFLPILREAGRRVTEACAPEQGYSQIDASKGYVHRAEEDEPWAIRGLIHPAFGEPSFAEFLGSPDLLSFVHSWCHGLRPEEMVMSGMLLWCNPRRNEHALSWHRDVTWWGTGKPYFAQREVRGEGPEAYAEEIERTRWEEIQANNAKALTERNGVSMFLALVDDECHELIPGSHRRWRTPFEHDVLLPKAMKEQGVPHTPSWNGVDPLPNQVAIRLKAGEALIRNGAAIHTGHTVPERERNTLSIGWSRWSGPFTGEPAVADARNAWQLDPVVREALPHEWMKTSWDRWAETQRLGETLEDRYAPFDIRQIKAGEGLGWRGELERQAAAAGEAWQPFQTLG